MSQMRHEKDKKWRILQLTEILDISCHRFNILVHFTKKTKTMINIVNYQDIVETGTKLKL